MSSLKGRIARMFSGVALGSASIATVQEIGGFQRLLLSCDVSQFSAGTKVQLLLPSDDMRTYSPIPASDGMVLLGWKGAGGPGSRWLSNVRPGEQLRFLGPQRSLELEAGPVVIVGDETSVAVAAAFAVQRPGRIHAVIQTDSPVDVWTAAESVGLRQLEVVSSRSNGATVDAVAGRVSDSPRTLVAVTGRSGLVAGVRDALRRAGVGNIKAKTYWVPGRTGLD